MLFRSAAAAFGILAVRLDPRGARRVVDGLEFGLPLEGERHRAEPHRNLGARIHRPGQGAAKHARGYALVLIYDQHIIQ